MSQSGERTVVVEGPPPPRTSRSLARALRVVDAGPVWLYRAALASLAATCVLAIGIALYVRPAGHLLRPQKEIILLGLLGLFAVGVLILIAVSWPAPRRAAFLDQLVAPDQRAAIWLALAVWFPFLLIAAYYRCKATLPSTIVWISFGFMDKRWVTATYLLGALAPMLVLVAAARVLAAGRAHPPSWRAWFRELGPRRAAEPDDDSAVTGTAASGTAASGTAASGTGASGTAPAASAHPAAAVSTARRGGAAHAADASRFRGAAVLRISAGVLTALGLAYYFYGPPWFLNRTFGASGIGTQEDVFLSGFQAISRGAVPYIGPAAIQYGPGAQLLSYWYMKHVATFSVVGFRESWAMFEWAGASIFFVVLFLSLGYLRGLLAAAMSALIYPALQLMGFVPGGAYSGFFGWANPLRYVGAISLLLLLPAVIRRSPGWRGLAGGAVLGVLWGGLSYVAQENLAAGLVGALAIGALLLLSGSSSWRSVFSGLAAVAAGFVLIWLPVLAYYLSKGLLGRFLYLYVLITRAVAEGYSNTPYGGVKPSRGEIRYDAPWVHMYYILPFFLVLLALLTVVQFRPFRIATDWSRDRIILVAVVLTSILLYQGALLRSDADHLTGTLLLLPALVVTAASVLPRALGANRRVTLVGAGVLVFVISFLLLPSSAFRLAHIRSEAEAPLLDRQRLAAAPVPATPATVAAQRAGPGLWAAPTCCQRDAESMRRFLALANQIHAAVGSRTTYVVGFPAAYPGLIYFVADIRPAPVPLDLHTMVFNTRQLAAYEAYYRSYVVPRTQALVTRHLNVQDVREFRSQHPHVKIITLSYRGKPYYVLLSSG
jgi:hypothetical protein